MPFVHRTQRTDKFHLYTAWSHRAGIPLWTRLFISIIRKEVFTSINIRRIRWGVYPPIAYHLVKYFLNWSETRDAMAQLTIPGYTIQPASPFEFSWIGILLLILLTEVFVVAVKLKQENDLTI